MLPGHSYASGVAIIYYINYDIIICIINNNIIIMIIIIIIISLLTISIMLCLKLI